MLARFSAHCSTVYQGRDVASVARAFGHYDVLGHFNLSNSKPSYTRKFRVCGRGCIWCGAIFCKCVTAYTDSESSDNDESVDYESDDVTKVARITFRTLLQWRKHLPRMAETQANPLQSVFHSISVFFRAACNTIKDLGESAIKSVLRALFGYATDVLREYLPNVDWPFLKFVALVVMVVIFQCLNVPFLFRQALVQFAAWVFGADLPSKIIVALFDVQVSCEQEIRRQMVESFERQARTQGPADLADLLEKIVLGFGAVCVTKFIPSDKGVMDFLVKCDRIPKAAKGLTNIAEYIVSVWNYIKNKIAAYMGWEQGIDSEIPSDVRNNFDEAVELGRAENRAQIALDAPIRERIKTLYSDYWRQRKLYSSSRTIMTFMDKYAGIVSTLMSKAADSTIGVTESRQKPVVTMIRGGTGVGKSELLYFMGTNVLAHLGAITPTMSGEEIKKKINSCMYPRMVENVYWEAYSEQPICLYDDFGQMTDSPTNPNLEFMELIRSANRFPYALHMAEISAKNNTFFKSKFIFATTNLPSIEPISVVDASAVRSRIDFGFEVRVKKEFQVNPEGTLPEHKKLDRAKVAHFGGPTLEIYEFQGWDPVTASLTAEHYTFEEVMKMIRQKEVEFNTHDQRAAEAFVAYARQAFTQSRVTDAITSVRQWVAPNVERAPEHPMEFAVRLLITEIVYECEKLMAKADLVMTEVWRKVYSYITVQNATIVIVGTLLTMLVYYFTRSTLSDDEVMMKNLPADRRDQIMEWMDDSEHYFYRMRRTLPPRIKDALQNEKDPVTLFNPVEQGDDAFKECFKYENALENFMHPDEFELYCETGKIPCEVLERMPLDRNIMAVTESGRDLPKIIARVEARAARTQAYTSKQAEEVIKMLRPCQFFIETQDKQISALVFAVGGTKVLINRHYWENLPEDLWFANCDSSSRIAMQRSEIAVAELPRAHYIDCLILTLPARVGMKKSVWRHFIRKKDLVSVTGKHVLLASRSHDKTVRILGGKILGYGTDTIPLNKVVRTMTFFESDVRTQDGDCGAVAVLDDNAFAGKICGFHYAGFLTGGAMSVPLVYEDFEKIMEGVAELVVPACVESVTQGLFRHAHNEGRVKQGVNNPTKTSFVPTVLHPEHILEKSEMAPVVLAPLSREDGPGRRALMKVDQDVPWIDPEDVLQAKESFKEVLFSFPKTTKRILTFEEAVQGADDIAFAKGINRSHSAGYPWMLETSKGKRKFFGEDEWTLDTPDALRVKDEVERRLALMKENKYEPCLYVDTLKDETRDLERVAQQKTRIFSAAPMDYIILMRMYFMSFFSFVMLNRNNNEISVGTQAQSPDWDVMARRLLSNRGGIIAGDFSNFDGTLHSEILLAVRDIINEWYDDGPENAQIRNFIFEDVVHSWHLTEKDVNSWNHSQPSGNPGTAIFNSMYNSLIMRLVYYNLAETQDLTHMDTFNRNVIMVSYGDDNVLSVSPSAKWYNQSSVTEVMKKFGMTYTLETKTGEAGEFRTLEEVQYLQRAFRFEPKISMWVAPLKKRSINERLYWNKKTPSPIPTLVENARGAIAEWALHDEQTYEHWAKAIVNALCAETGNYLAFRGQGYYLQFVRTGEYGTAFPAVSYA
uniref:Nonstructural polyprotein n=1 Tax=Robinvale bee virus 1 TaxID=2201312 RepID=A0A2U8JQA4_9VIRU|nr:nonstructural polyprotein [Robinvale bee virus 1]